MRKKTTMMENGKFYMSMNNFIIPNWNAPLSVKSLVTTRLGGLSKAPYNTFNLGAHVGDDLGLVLKNRQILAELLPDTPCWLNQTHSDKILWLDQPLLNNNTLAENLLLPYDASFTHSKNKVCVIMSADCIPILLTDKNASFVAAIHAGWRGVENGIIKKTISNISVPGSNMLAYIAPAICKDHFEVGPEVVEMFIHQDKSNRLFFSENGNGKFLCDLTAIAKNQLKGCGLLENNIYMSNLCTYCNEEQFFSYRRDRITGRMASLIWLS